MCVSQGIGVFLIHASHWGKAFHGWILMKNILVNWHKLENKLCSINILYLLLNNLCFLYSLANIRFMQINWTDPVPYVVFLILLAKYWFLPGIFYFLPFYFHFKCITNTKKHFVIPRYQYTYTWYKEPTFVIFSLLPFTFFMYYRSNFLMDHCVREVEVQPKSLYMSLCSILTMSMEIDKNFSNWS